MFRRIMNLLKSEKLVKASMWIKRKRVSGTQRHSPNKMRFPCDSPGFDRG